jgi:hypothetical protein
MFWRRPRVSANEFVLLVAIPLTRDEFADDQQRRTDFLRSNAAASSRRGASAWTSYAPYADLCRRIVDEVESWGVVVVRRPTMPAFVSAAGRFRTVTLVAHARGPEIVPCDLLDVPRLRASFSDVMSALGAEGPAPADVVTMASRLNEALGPEDVQEEIDNRAMSETEAMAWRVALYRERWRRRSIVQRLVPGALTGGPAIEFQDGLAPIAAIGERLPRFDVLDLTVCDSVLLAECIREINSDGVILSNPRPTTPDFRLAVYREAVRFAVRHRTPYPDAVIRLRRYLRRHTA